MLLGFNLLDRQIVDRDGVQVGKVDDLELSRTEDGALYVSALLTGQQVLGRRIGGWLGREHRAPARTHPRTGPDPHPLRPGDHRGQCGEPVGTPRAAHRSPVGDLAARPPHRPDPGSLA
jgi:hypothetical protein